MAQYVDPRSSYEQVAADLRAQIMSGDLKPGMQLPITAVLAENFGVSPTTIQRVQRALETEGHLRGVNGKGVFVRSAQPVVIDAAVYIEPSPDGASYKLISVGERRPPADAAEALGLSGDALAVERHQVMSFAGVPAEVIWAYYPTDIARGTALSGPKKIRGGSPRVLREAGIACQEPEDDLSWRGATTGEAELLELPAGVPVLRTLRVVRSAEGRPVEVFVLVKAGHQFRLRYRAPSH